MMSGGHDFSFIFLHSLSTNFCQKGNIYDKSFWWTKVSQFIIDKEINTSSFNEKSKYANTLSNLGGQK